MLTCARTRARAHVNFDVINVRCARHIIRNYPVTSYLYIRGFIRIYSSIHIIGIYYGFMLSFRYSVRRQIVRRVLQHSLLPGWSTIK